jgi:DNA-binding LacI/PurR family transcriptional regulator
MIDDDAAPGTRAAQARGLRIPDDISVVAMLGEMSGELATPPLTTIGFPADDMGRAAGRMMVEMITKGGPGHQTLLKTDLNIRGSTMAPARSLA